jgi:long-chain acyl-CoA synthetase
MDLLIGDMLRRNAQKYPNKIAVIYKDKKITYQELNSRANRLADALLNAGLKQKDKVATLFYNCSQYVEIMYGLAKAGLVMVPINFRFVDKEIDYIIKNSKSKLLLAGIEFSDTLKNCVDIKTISNDYEKLLSESSPEEPQITVRENDIFFIGYTSGTTGAPKGAARAHRADTMTVATTALELEFSRKDITLIVMPMFHCNSIWFTLTTLAMGGAVCIYPSGSFNPEEILETIFLKRITFTSLVPTMYTLILNLRWTEKHRYDMSSMRALLCSSAPLMTKTKKKILSFFKGIQLFEGYGATETGLATVLRPQDQ